MSIWYSLLLKQPLTFEQHLRPVLSSHNVQIIEITSLPKGIQIHTPDIIITIIDTSDAPFGWESHLLLEEYKNSQRIGFTLKKSSTTAETASKVLTIALSLLDDVSSALFLLIDNVVFHWDGSLLLINNDFGFWDVNDRIQKILDKPYRNFG